MKNEVIKTEEIVTRIETSLKIELTKILQEAKNVFSLVSAIKAKTDRLP